MAITATVPSTTTVDAPTFAAKLSAAVFYGVSSILIVFTNKIVLTSFGFPSFLFLAIGQMVASIVLLFVGRGMGIITFPRYSHDIILKIFPLPLVFGLNLVTGLGGTKHLNLPMFTVLRRFSIFMTMCLEYFILGVHATTAVRVSVGLMLLGSFIAAIFDLSFDSYGYGLVLVNDLCTALNGVYMKKKLDAKDLGKYGLMFYNALFAIGPTIFIGYLMGEFETLSVFRNWTNPGFLFAFLLSCVCGFILNYSIVLCTQVNSALTTACVGPIKNLFVTYGGMFLGGDYIFAWNNFLGINVSVIGSILYTYVTFRTGAGGGGKPKKAKISPLSSSSATDASIVADPQFLSTNNVKPTIATNI